MLSETTYPDTITKSRPHAIKARNAGKSFLQISFLILLFSITAFSQDRRYREIFPNRIISERLSKIQKSNIYGLEGFNDRESLLLKSNNSNWQTVVRNPQREFYEVEGFYTKDTRTTINKTLLSNGFILIEGIYQGWDGSVWVNGRKDSYTYDGNNNRTEILWQGWDGSAWVNDWKVY